MPNSLTLAKRLADRREQPQRLVVRSHCTPLRRIESAVADGIQQQPEKTPITQPAAAVLGLLLLLGSSDALAGESQICRYCRHCTAGNAATATAKETIAARHYAPDRQVDVLHIKLDVTPDFKQRTVAGTATIEFRPISKPLQSLRLDAVHLRVSDVRSEQEISDYSVSDDEIHVVFDPPIAVDQQASVEIDYQAEPTKGLYFRTPEMGYAESDTHLWTQGEPNESRHWFPCFDAPNERSTTEVICRVPEDMIVLSNGRQMDEQVDSATGMKRVRWLQEKPHVNYLICLVAGRLEGIHQQHGQVPLGFYTQPSIAQYARNGFLDTAQIMEFYETEIGVPFPWDKYYQVTIGDFMWGGMENTTLTTLHQRAVFADETENVRTNRRLDAHELAHQWFGNYVTCKDWSHLWLNEGFATYYTLLYEAHKFGRDALLHGLYLDAKDDIFAQKDDAKPIVFRQYSEPTEQFDYRAYPKGSWVLHMLRSRFGDELYRRAIRRYLEQHALTHVETEELRAAFEDLTGETLDRFFDQWVYHGRHPELKIAYKWMANEKLAHVTIEQQQDVNEEVLQFEFSTKLRFIIDGRAVDHPIDVSEAKHDFYVRLPAQPTIVRFDPDYTVLADIEFSKPDAMLEAQLSNGDDVVGRLYACEALGKRDAKAAVDALQNALQNDAFYGVRQAAAESLREIGDDRACQALADSIKQSDARVRLSVVQQLAKFYRSEAREKLLTVAQQEKNPEIAAAAVEGLDKYQGPQVDQALRAALTAKSFRNEAARAALRAIGQRRAHEFQAEVVAALNQSDPELDAETVVLSLKTLAKISESPKIRPAAFDVITRFLEHPRQRYRIEAVRALGELGDQRAYAILRPLVEDDRDDRLSKAADAALKKLDEEARLAPKEVAELRKEVRSLKEKMDKLQESLDDLEAKAKPEDDKPQEEKESVTHRFTQLWFC